MAVGDLTASTPTLCATSTEVKTAVDAITLAAVTDTVQIISIPLGGWYVFKVERAAA